MGRRQFNDGQEIVYGDFNKMGASIERELYDRVIFELISRAEDSFFDDSFQVNYSSPTAVSVNAGVGFQTDATQVDPEPEKRLLYRDANVTVNLTSPHASLNRIDLIVCKAARVDGDTESRKFKNALTSAITSESMVVSNEWEAEVIKVDGTPNASPVAPSVPAGYIKLAEVLVTAVTGVSGSGAITDFRDLMPVAGLATINSLAFSRLTTNAALSIQQALAEVDALLVNGQATTNILADSITDPTAPPSGAGTPLKLYNKGGVLFTRDEGGTISPVGGGGGGGGGAQWYGDSLEDTEYNQKVKKFTQGDTQKETIYIKVPQSYIAGRQITMYLGHYSPSSSNQWKMQAVSTLIRKNQDAITSTTNQNTSNSGDLTNTVANMMRELTLTLTSATGTVNSVAVSAGDTLKVELTRIAPGGSEDTAEVRMVPATTEVKFS